MLPTVILGLPNFQDGGSNQRGPCAADQPISSIGTLLPIALLVVVSAPSPRIFSARIVEAS
jgi:hypothetical protein